MFKVRMHGYNEVADNFDPVGYAVPCLTLSQAKELAKKSHNETGEYYAIESFEDETFILWHDEI